jgi:hypothetical protein
MSTERLPGQITALPRANLADAVALRSQVLAQASGLGALPAWRHLQEALTRLLVCVQVHPCAGRRCAKCAEYYALLQVLEHRKRQLLQQHGERVTWPS